MMLDADSLATDGLGRAPETDNAALLLEKVDPAELGRVIPMPSSLAPELAVDAVATGCGRAAASCLKMRSRASLYAVSRSSSVSSRLPLPFPLAEADPLADALPSSSAPIEEEAEEAVREADERGRILKIAGGTILGVSAELEVVGAKETEGEDATEGDGEGEAAALLGVRGGPGEETTSVAGTKLASLAVGL